MERRRRGCGCGPVFIILIIVAIFLVGRAGSDLDDEYDYDPSDSNYDYEYFDDDETDGYIPSEAPTDTSEDSLFSVLELPLYRSKYFELNDIGKQIYRGMREAVVSDRLEVTFSNADYNAYGDVAFQALKALYHDFPEFFWLNCGGEYQGYQNGDFTVKMYCYDYWTYTTDRAAYVSAVENAAVKLFNEANAQPTDYDKMKYLHDYLVTHVLYDDVCVEEVNKTVQRASSQQSHTVYGALVSNLAVCDGYAKTFQLITDMMGMDTEFITGDAGGGHAWNYVTVNGKAYWMDVTWDDLDLEYEKGENYYPDYIGYDYYCVHEADFYKDHTPDNYFKLPKCVSMDDNYHVLNGYYLDYYDFDAVCDVFAKQQGQKYITVRFSNASEFKKAVNDLLGTFGKYNSIPSLPNSSNMRYLSDEATCTLTLLYR